MWKRVLLILGIVLVLVAGALVYVIYRMQDVEFWEFQIRDYEESDQQHPPDPGIIVFTGSSSIRYWNTLEQDLAPLPVINRGFGGAHFSHVNFYAPRIVLPYEPRIVVIYAGDNDLARKHKTPQSVAEDFRAFAQMIHTSLPETQILLISIKPSILRRRHWDKMQQANKLLSTIAEQDERIEYIDVATVMLDGEGEPSKELFKWDGLHLSAEGYALWASIIKPILERAWLRGRAEQGKTSVLIPGAQELVFGNTSFRETVMMSQLR